MKITLISDTHNKHNQITSSLPGGDLLIHAGDISSMGYKHEIQQFCKWFNSLDNYDNKIFIAGNHDFGFQDKSNESKEIIDSSKQIGVEIIFANCAWPRMSCSSNGCSISSKSN